MRNSSLYSVLLISRDNACYDCHDASDTPPLLYSYEATLPFAVPGKPDESRIYENAMGGNSTHDHLKWTDTSDVVVTLKKWILSLPARD